MSKNGFCFSDSRAVLRLEERPRLLAARHRTAPRRRHTLRPVVPTLRTAARRAGLSAVAPEDAGGGGHGNKGWKKSFYRNIFVNFSFFQEVSILFELLGLSAKESLQCNAGGLLQRIAHLKVAVSALTESSKENVDAVTINGNLEDVEIVHRKTNGTGVHMMDLTAVEALEVKIDKKNHSNNK